VRATACRQAALFGDPFAAPPIPEPDQFTSKPDWSTGIATLDAGAYAHSARTDPPAAFLRANARPAADVRPAPVTPR